MVVGGRLSTRGGGGTISGGGGVRTSGRGGGGTCGAEGAGVGVNWSVRNSGGRGGSKCAESALPKGKLVEPLAGCSARDVSSSGVTGPDRMLVTADGEEESSGWVVAGYYVTGQC